MPDPRDERTVCAFYLVAVDVPDVRELTWRIAPRPNPRKLPGIDGTILIEAGRGHTGPYTLPSGSYELTWPGAGEERGADRRKAFTVACPPGDQGQPPTNDPPPAAADEARGDARATGRNRPRGGRARRRPTRTGSPTRCGAQARRTGTGRTGGRGAVPCRLPPTGPWSRRRPHPGSRVPSGRSWTLVPCRPWTGGSRGAPWPRAAVARPTRGRRRPGRVRRWPSTRSGWWGCWWAPCPARSQRPA